MAKRQSYFGTIQNDVVSGQSGTPFIMRKLLGAYIQRVDYTDMVKSENSELPNLFVSKPQKVKNRDCMRQQEYAFNKIISWMKVQIDIICEKLNLEKEVKQKQAIVDTMAPYYMHVYIKMHNVKDAWMDTYHHIPHASMKGPPGTGKTTTMVIIAAMMRLGFMHKEGEPGNGRYNIHGTANKQQIDDLDQHLIGTKFVIVTQTNTALNNLMEKLYEAMSKLNDGGNNKPFQLDEVDRCNKRSDRAYKEPISATNGNGKPIDMMRMGMNFSAWDKTSREFGFIPLKNNYVDEKMKNTKETYASVLNPAAKASGREPASHTEINRQRAEKHEEIVKEFTSACVSKIFIWLSTIGSLNYATRYKLAEHIDLVLMDEAGQVPEYNLSKMAGILPQVNYLLAIGDSDQLGPFSFLQSKLPRIGMGKFVGLCSDIFGSVIHNGENSMAHKGMLTKQYRMHPLIGEYISRLFYENKLQHAQDENYGKSIFDALKREPWFRDRVQISVVNGPDYYRNPDIHCIDNDMEAIYATMLVEKAVSCLRKEGLDATIAILCMYKAQKRLVEAYMSHRGVRNTITVRQDNTIGTTGSNRIVIETSTVDGFQGKEADIVFVLTTQTQRVGFMKEYNRLNVASSRARFYTHLIVCGAILLDSLCVGMPVHLRNPLKRYTDLGAMFNTKSSERDTRDEGDREYPIAGPLARHNIRPFETRRHAWNIQTLTDRAKYNSRPVKRDGPAKGTRGRRRRLQTLPKASTAKGGGTARNDKKPLVEMRYDYYNAVFQWLRDGKRFSCYAPGQH